MIAYGKNVFKELSNDLNKIRKVYLSKTFKEPEIIKFIQDNHLKYDLMDPRALDRMCEGNHQGIIVVIDDYEYTNYHDLFDNQIIVILDHLEDPHNFGAIIRTCEAAGITSIIIPRDRSVTVNETVMKTSSGALSYVKIAQVSNLVNVIKEFQAKNYFVYAADMDGINYKKVDFAEKCVLIVGSEGKGVSRLVKAVSDEVVAIPMKGKVNSLNASVAAAVLIYGVINR